MAGERQSQSAALLYRRTDRATTAAAYSVEWSVEGWISHVLDSYPGCRTAGVVLSPVHCVARVRGGSLASVRIEPPRENGRIVHSDPAAVLSAVHARPAGVSRVTCVIGGRRYEAHLSPATAEEAGRIL